MCVWGGEGGERERERERERRLNRKKHSNCLCMHISKYTLACAHTLYLHINP